MPNGYLIAAGADLAAARELAEGFELDVLEFAALGDGAVSLLASAQNVGVLLSFAATRDAAFFALVQKLSLKLPRAQLIVVDANAVQMFGFLPQGWPAMPFEEARRRAIELKRRRQAPPPQETQEPVHAAPMPPVLQPAPAAPPQPEPPQPEPPEHEAVPDAAPAPPPADEQVAASLSHDDLDDVQVAEEAESPAAPMHVDAPAEFGGEPPTELSIEPPAKIEAPPEIDARAEGGLRQYPAPVSENAEAPAELPSMPPSPAPAAAAPAPAPSYSENAYAQSAPRARVQSQSASYEAGRSAGAGASLTADASAFAPKKLRRETPELLRVVIYQPHQLKDVLKTAKKIDPRAEAAPQGMRVGEVALGESVGVSLEVRGASCDGAIQRRVWRGEPIDFSFTLEAEDDVRQAVILARVFAGDAQVGVIAFTRPITGAASKAAADERLKLKRHKRVFLSYSSHDREIVSAIATAYEAAGIPYFWDRSSLESGEEWSPRLRKEIDKADLFHLCWSKAASKSEWVVTEAEHALTRRKKSNGKNPDITVQMLDGPPWAPHPLSLDSINFDDFVRAAVVGYARGDGNDAV